jgi:hypothetical protein
MQGTIQAFAWKDWEKPRHYDIPQDSRSSGRNMNSEPPELNSEPPEYVAGVLITGPRRSVEHKGTKDARSVEISSSHGGEYDVQSCLLGYTAV